MKSFIYLFLILVPSYVFAIVCGPNQEKMITSGRSGGSFETCITKSPSTYKQPSKSTNRQVSPKKKNSSTVQQPAKSQETCDKNKAQINWAYGNSGVKEINSKSPCQCVATGQYTDYEGSKSCPDVVGKTCVSDAKPVEDPLSDKDCVCGDGSFVNFGVACPIAKSVEPEVIKTTDSELVNSCFNDLRLKVAACKKAAYNANTTCSQEKASSKGDEDSSNSGVEAGQAVLGVLARVKVGQNAGTGNVGSCMITALGTQTGWALLNKFKTGCEADISACDSECEDLPSELKSSALQEKYEGCLAKDNSNQGDLSYNSYKTLVEQLNDDYDMSVKACKESAPTKKSDMVNEMHKAETAAQQSAQICDCQTVAGANCNKLPTLSQCNANANLAGCNVYTSNCVATPNSAQCVCAAHPEQCVTNNNPTLSNMAQMLTNSPSVTPSGTFKVGGGPNGSNLNFGDDEATKVASGTAQSDGGSPFAAAQGGGGGGGGGPGGGGLQNDPNQAAPAEEGDKKGVGGLLTSAKNFMSDLFGPKKASSTSPNANGFNKNRIDPNLWRPKGVRGLAAEEYAIGTKNKNIFDIMQNRYSDQTHTFFGPNEPTK